MPISRKLLCAVYATIAVAALIATWSQNVAYFQNITDLVGGLVIAISVTFPLFLVARELRLATPDATHLRAADIIPLAVLAALSAGLVVWVDVL